MKDGVQGLARISDYGEDGRLTHQVALGQRQHTVSWKKIKFYVSHVWGRNDIATLQEMFLNILKKSGTVYTARLYSSFYFDMYYLCQSFHA